MPIKQILRNDANVYDLQKDGDLTWRDGKRYLNDADSGVTMGPSTGHLDARVIFKESYDVHRALLKSDDLFMTRSFFDAQASEAVWLGHAGQPTDVCQSRSVISIPQGAYKQTIGLLTAFNIIRGHGSSEFWTNGNNLDKWNGTKAQGGTQLIVDHPKWTGTQTDCQIQGATWGMEGGNSYQENITVDLLFLDGAKRGYTHDPTRQIGAIKLYDAGSASNIGPTSLQLKRHEGAALTFCRGTPQMAGRIVAMYNNTAAVDLMGDGIFEFKNLEVDSSARVFRVRNGFGRNAGGVLRCGFLKMEDGDDGISSERPINTSQAVVDMEDPGWVDMLFETIAYSSKNFNADLFRMNCPLGQGYNTSSLRVNMLRSFGAYHCLVHDVFNKKAWNSDHGTNYGQGFQSHIKSFNWNNWSGGQLITGAGEYQPPPTSRPNPWRMNSQNQVAMTGEIPQPFDDAAGTPKYIFIPQSVTTPPPTAPVITSFLPSPASLGAPGAVRLTWTVENTTKVTISGVSGSFAGSGFVDVQVSATTSFTLTAEGPGGTTTAMSTVSVASAPPATWFLLWSGTKVDKSTCKTVPTLSITKVRLTNWKPTADGRILGSGALTPNYSLQLYLGDFYFNGAKCTSSVGKVVNGTLYPSVVVTLPTGVIMAATTCWQVQCETTWSHNGACVCDCAKLEVQ